jgi:hypothetical protein
MTDVVEPAPVEVERSQTRTLIRHDDFDEEDDDRDVVTVEKDRKKEESVEQIRSTNIDRSKGLVTDQDEGSAESSAPPSRATTDPASTIRDSGYSDVTSGSRNFTPGFKFNFLVQSLQFKKSIVPQNTNNCIKVQTEIIETVKN